MELQSVIRNLCVSREPGFGGVRKVVANVGEVSRLRFYARGCFERLANAQMRWMRFVTQGVDDQDFHARDKIDNRIRHGAAIA
jgi:hypothetical protein